MSSSNDQDAEVQKLFDDVDKIIQLLQSKEYTRDNLVIGPVYILAALLTLAKAVQTLRPCDEPTPTECTPAPSTETQSKPPKEQEDALLNLLVTEQEWELILHMRREGLSADRLTTYLSSVDHIPDQSLRMLVQYLREET